VTIFIRPIFSLDAHLTSFLLPPYFLPFTASALCAHEQSRLEFLTQAGASLTAGIFFAATAAPQPALAAKYGSLGAGSPEVLDPSQAEVDSDVLESGAVQKALIKVQGYQASVKTMQTSLVNDKQANVKPVLIKELDFGDLRATLNTVNTAFEEDTQRGTDRLIRVIIQDIAELEIANKQKEGIPRSDRKVGTMNAKLDKLDKAFGDYLAFAKK
jgi:hypothetical protein